MNGNKVFAVMTRQMGTRGRSYPNYVKDFPNPYGIIGFTADPKEAKRFTKAEADAEERRMRQMGTNAYAVRIG